MKENIRLKNKVAIFRDSRIQGMDNITEKELLVFAMSIDADARKPLPKPPKTKAMTEQEIKNAAEKAGVYIAGPNTLRDQIRFAELIWNAAMDLAAEKAEITQEEGAEDSWRTVVDKDSILNLKIKTT